MPKMIRPLSESEVRDAKYEDKIYRLFDGGGLYLQITPSGGKWWRFKYRFRKKEKGGETRFIANLLTSLTR
jgi:hypothetical protein